jgi:hypothetical protein
VFRGKKSELKKRYTPHPLPKKKFTSINAGGNTMKEQPIITSPVKRYIKTPLYKPSGMFPEFNLPEINLPEILQVFSGGKRESTGPGRSSDIKIPFIKKPVKHN